MNHTSGFSRIRRALCAVLMAAVIAAAAVVLGGCSFFRDLTTEVYAEFTVNSLTLTVGDTYDMSDVIDANTSSYVISVGSTRVLSVNGKKVTANSAGRTTVSVTTGGSYIDDTITVIVKNKEASELYISHTGELMQTVGNTSAVTFAADARGDIKGGTVEWYVNDNLMYSCSTDKQFVFTPSSAGKYKVKATIDEYSASTEIYVYYGVEASATSSGALNQTSGEIGAIVFSATVSSHAENPADYIKWVVDGNTVQEGESKIFRYMPSAGTHVVELYVNGQKRLIDGQPSVTVMAAGKAKTPNVPTVTFDNVYPHVYIDYAVDAGSLAEVEIVLPDGSTRTVSQAETRYASLFEENRMDAQGIISVCASGSVKNKYKIRVRALGDGGLIKASEYSATCTFTQIDASAKPYLESTVLDFDRYLTSEEEYIDVLEYEILNREKTVRKPKVEFSCYAAFGLRNNSEAEDLFLNAFEWAATSGNYDNIIVEVSKNVLKTSFTVSTVNRPTKQSYTGGNSYKYAKELHAITPHVNYDEEKFRDANHVFPIDRKERTATVSYTDELYFAVEHNTKPLPTAGSAAETVYEKAREVLRMIVTDDMTDVEKAHAIYDWIMWKVAYDTPATEVASDGEAYSAYYLEGVFGDGVTPIKDMSTGASVTYAPFAVCDGLSKAYSLLCNIEGVPCVRVAGTAGDSLVNAGGHAWNKVFVDGAWYIVDVTWGDAQGRVNNEVCELSLHDWLFLTDEQADPTHFEPYESNDSYLINVPETATSKFDVYDDMVYNGVTIDCSIGDGEDQEQRLREIARLFAKSYEPRTKLDVPGCGTSVTKYTGIDVKFETSIALTERNAANIVRTAVRNVVPSASVDVYLTSDKTVLVILIS